METARVCAVFMDPQDDGIGAKKEAKDARASMRITCLRRLYVVSEEVIEGRIHGMKEWIGPTQRA